MESLRIIAAAMLATLFAVGTVSADPRPIRIGHFPNITHAQPLLGRATGSYEKELGAKIEWVQFNAGPSAVEALFSGEIDASYIGPTPAVNGFLKSHGQAFVIVAGSAQGGAGLVVRSDAGIATPKDLIGKQISTPQLGNTQDIAARHFLKGQGIELKEKGGATSLIPLANADSLTMLQRKQIDAVWTVEPWLSRLEIEGGGKLLIDEKDLWPNGRYPTTVLVVTRKFLKEDPIAAAKLLRAHLNATKALNADPKGTSALINEELKKETGKSLTPEVLERALSRVKFDATPLPESLEASLKAAQDVDFASKGASIVGIWDLELLNETSDTLDTPGKTTPEQ